MKIKFNAGGKIKRTISIIYTIYILLAIVEMDFAYTANIFRATFLVFTLYLVYLSNFGRKDYKKQLVIKAVSLIKKISKMVINRVMKAQKNQTIVMKNDVAKQNTKKEVMSTMELEEDDYYEDDSVEVKR